MNKYPTWLNFLVLAMLAASCLLALPNLYGSAPAVQIASSDGIAIEQESLDKYLRVVEDAGITPEAAYLKGGQAVMCFDSVGDQEHAGASLRKRFSRQVNVALTKAPKLPGWVRDLGLSPMSLGLDLRGGVYVLLEVAMDDAIDTRIKLYEQDFYDRLREAGILPRVNVSGQTINIRLRNSADMASAYDIIRAADADVAIIEGADGKSLTVRMTEAQIKARQDFAIEQNLTTLRNRVNQLGVAEPLVQRQGADRIVVQLPGVQDPNQLNKILTATATLEFRLVDVAGDLPGSRRYNGRGNEAPQVLKRRVIASGDQIID